jgi:hypothetical protein
MMRALRTHGPRIAVGVVLAALALVLAGCGGGNPSTAPGSPTEPAVKQLPEPTASAGTTSSSSVHKGAPSEDVYRQISAALTAQGYKIASTSGMRMTYAADGQSVTVEGGGITTKDGKTVQRIQVQPSGSGWRVLNVVSEQ